MTTDTRFEPHPIPDGTVEMDGRTYMADAKGSLVPVDLIKPKDREMDRTVRRIIGFSKALSEQMARFLAHTHEDIDGFVTALAENYGQYVGGAKGNMTLTSVDGLYQVKVAMADRLEFGPELQIAKGLIDECLNEWSEDARPEIQAIVTHAFNTDQEGKINRAEILRLKRLEVADARWQRAMDAIRDAERITSTKTYVRCYERGAIDEAWRAIPLDVAKMGRVK